MGIGCKAGRCWSTRLGASTLASSLAIALISSTPASASGPPAADLILKNGRVYTVDGSHRIVDALAVRNGKLVFVGSNAAVSAFIGRKTTVEDVHGKLVLPGLVDAHIHPRGIVDFGGCNLQATAHTLAEIASLVRQCLVDAKLAPGKWLSVSQWEYAAGNQTDPKHPTLRAALDDAAPDNPVMMTGWDGHHAAFNSRGLALAKNAKGETVGYSKATLLKDFAQYKAVVGVDSNGDLSGDIQDEGRLPIDTSETSREDFERLLAEPQRLALRLNSDGITAIWDAAAYASDGIFGPGSIYDVYDKLEKNGQQSFRVNLAQFWKPEDFEDSDGRVNWDMLFAKAEGDQREGLRMALLGLGILAFALGFGEPFLEALEEAAQAVDRGGAERLGDAVAVDLDPAFVAALAALAPAGGLGGGGADRRGGDLAHDRAGIGLDRLLDLLAHLPRHFHPGDLLGNPDGSRHGLSPRVLI